MTGTGESACVDYDERMGQRRPQSVQIAVSRSLVEDACSLEENGRSRQS